MTVGVGASDQRAGVVELAAVGGRNSAVVMNSGQVKHVLGCRLVQGYGMTELSPAGHLTPLDGGERLVGSVAPLSSTGWTVSNSVSKIIDPATRAEIDVPAKGLSDAGEL